MESGEREQLLRQKIEAMDDSRFEQLVLALVEIDHAPVHRIQHPDGGADVIRSREGAETAEEVWQAKHYTRNVQWTKCEQSLSDAIKRWKPTRVTFVFSMDLSQHGERSFAGRQHTDAVAAGRRGRGRRSRSCSSRFVLHLSPYTTPPFHLGALARARCSRARLRARRTDRPRRWW